MPSDPPKKLSRYREAKHLAEREILIAAECATNNGMEAARWLGISHRMWCYLRRKYGLQRQYSEGR